MKPLIIAPVLLVLAACQSSVPFDPVSDRCGSLGHFSLVGNNEDVARAANLPEGTRFIRPDTAVTRDYRAERLNVHINDKGRVERVSCG